MIVETDGYVHALYQGKLDPRYQNLVKVVAIPHLYNSAGVELDPTTLTYQWRKNGLVLQSDSGIGKQSLLVAGEVVPRAYSITVDVRSRDGSIQATGMANVEPIAPFVFFYVNDPLYGPLYQKAIGQSVSIGSEREISVSAIPYGFNEKRFNTPELSQRWFINGVERPELAFNENIILRSPEQAGGSATVQLTMRNLKEILQGATSGFHTIFTAATPEVNTTTF